MSAITVTVTLADEDFSGLYDRLELWRSVAEAGPYEELTAATEQPARAPATAADPITPMPDGRLAYLLGKTLSLVVGTAELEITMDLPVADPIYYSVMANLVTTRAPGLAEAYVTEDNDFVVQTLLVGRSARLQIPSSDIAALVGLPFGDTVYYGKDARKTLLLGVHDYTFVDPYGDAEYWYRIRMRHSLTGATSAYSKAFQVPVSVGVPATDLVEGYLSLAKPDGTPAVNREVRVRLESSISIVGGFLVVPTQDLSAMTDDDGYVSFTLARGARMRVSVEGTDLVRVITVPVDPTVTSFWLLDPTVVDTTDYYAARVPQIITAQPRSL